MDRADGSIVIACDLDDRDAQSKLNKLKADIAKLNAEIEKKTAERDRHAAKAAQLKPLAERDPETFKSTYDLWQGQADKLNSEIAQLQEQLMQTEQEAGAVVQRLASPEAVTATEQTEKNVEQTNQELAETEQKVENINKSAKKTTGSFSKIGKSAASFGKKLLTMVKAVFIFNAISAALRGLKGWLTSVIQSDSELSAAMAQLRGALRTAAQPILNVLIPALRTLIQFIAKVVAAIASLVSSLFGTTIESSAAAAQSLYDQQNAYEGVGGAAKDASKQLAGFDEINKLTAESGGGGGASAVKPNFQIDEGLIGQVQGFLDRTGIGKALEDLFTAIGKLKKGLEEFWNSTAGQIVKLVLKETFITAIKLLADALSVLAAVLSGDLWSALDSLQKMSWDAIFGVLKIFAGIIDLIFNPEGSLGVSATDAVTKAEEFINKLPKVSEAAKIAKDNLGKVFEPFTKKVKALYYLLQSEWYYVKWWYIRNVKEKLEAIWQPVQDAWDTLIKWLRGDGTAEAAETGETLGEAFANSLKEAFIAVAIIINGIIGSIETALNMLISKINSLSIDIPNKPIYGAFAGEHVGFNIPPVSIPRITIPGLAQGAVIPPNREFLAVLGDQKSGTNVEAPLETIVAAVRAAVGNGNRTVVLELDRRELGRAVLDVYGQENKRVGLKLGGSYA